MSNPIKVFDRIAQGFPGNRTGTAVAFGEPVLTVDRESAKELLVWLRNDPESPFDALVDLFGIDRQDGDLRFEIVYILRSNKTNERVTVKTRVDEKGLDTVSDIWKAADWCEREVYDLFGIRFNNHPDLRRLFNNDDFEGYPLRKDFPTEGYDYDKPFVVNLEENKA